MLRDAAASFSCFSNMAFISLDFFSYVCKAAAYKQNKITVCYINSDINEQDSKGTHTQNGNTYYSNAGMVKWRR